MTLLQKSALAQAAPLWQGLHRNDELPGEMAIAVRASVGRTVVRGLLRHLANPGWAAELYEQLLSCLSLPHQQQSKVAAAILEALLVRIGAEPETPTGLTARRRGAFNRCREYLVANYAILRGPGAAARACRVGPEYFSRLFREHAGQTPSQFLARLRMQHAARLLQQSEVSVKAAGLAVGFDDPYHFSRVFKQIHGMAPRDFQRGVGR